MYFSKFALSLLLEILICNYSLIHTLIQDGRLRPNDQLLYINEESLISISNSSAMEILRRSMAGDKSPRSHIRLVVARRTDPGDITPTSSRWSDRGVDTKAESVDGDMMLCPGSPVSMSSRGMDLDMDAMDELFKHPVLNKLNAIEVCSGLWFVSIFPDFRIFYNSAFAS